MWGEYECPVCKKEMEISTSRWDGQTVCPQKKCGAKLIVEFDMIYDEESNEEWDLFDIKEMKIPIVGGRYIHERSAQILNYDEFPSRLVKKYFGGEE